MRIALLLFFIGSVYTIAGCSAQYSIGKILVVDETKNGLGMDLSQTAQRLLRDLKNIRAADPPHSNSTLKITLNQINTPRGKEKGKKRYHLSLLLTATLKNGNIQIFQAESTSASDINMADHYSQIEVLLRDSLLRLDYQCTIRRREEGELFSIFSNRKTTVWQREAILEEMANRISSDNIKDRQATWNFLFQVFTTKRGEFGEKIIGIISAMDISKFNLSDTQRDLLTKELIRYCIGREAYIQINIITILSRINNDIAKSFIFTLSTGSPNKVVQDHAKEVLNELERHNINPAHTITSK